MSRPPKTVFAARWICSAAAMAALALPFTGCVTKDPPKAVSKHETLAPKNVPPYLKDTIFEKTDLTNVGGFAVSSYGLVSRLRGTGDSASVPTSVRKWMIDQMVKRGYGQ